MRSQVISIAVIAAALHAAAAEAKPRVVVAEFDGPRRLADSGRTAVMGVLGDQYNIIATKNWDTARARFAGRGPQQWRQASKQAGVDAVIEGWVQEEGRHFVLTVAVREAITGRELDTLSVRIKEGGVSPQAAQKFAVQLEELLNWIDGDINADPTPSLPDVRTVRPPMLGSTKRHQRIEEPDDEEDEGDDDRGGRRGSRYEDDRDGGRRGSRDDEERYGDRRDDDRRGDDRRGDRRGDDREPSRREQPRKTLASIDTPKKEEATLVSFFGPESEEAKVVTEGKIARKPKATPRFVVDAGPYVSARGMSFTYDPDANGSPPDYPGQTLKGFAARAGVFPMPIKKTDGELSGIGFSLGVQHSVLSTFAAMDDTGYGDYTLNHSAWDMGVHYRYPVDFVTLDAGAEFGNFTHTIVDLPESVQIPDTSYSYLGLGAHLDLKVAEGTTVGFGARYMYLLSAGDISDQNWYGAGKAWGATLNGDFVIPIASSLYVRGDVEYRRVKVDFEGSGDLTMEWGVWDVVDSSISGSASIGVKF
jgi:hypothetical protein